jgi:hypothetical protein
VTSYPSPYLRSYYVEVDNKIFKAGDDLYNIDFPEEIFYVASTYGKHSYIYMIRHRGWEDGDSDPAFDMYFHKGAILEKCEQ